MYEQAQTAPAMQQAQIGRIATLAQPTSNPSVSKDFGVLTTRQHLIEEANRLEELSLQFLGGLGLPQAPEEPFKEPSNLAEFFAVIAVKNARSYDRIRRCFEHITG